MVDKICPIRMHAYLVSSDLKSENDIEITDCVVDLCAWFNAANKMCSVCSMTRIFLPKESKDDINFQC